MDLSTVFLVVGVTFCAGWLVGLVTERWRHGDDDQSG